MSDTQIKVKRGRGRPRKNPEDKVSNAEAQRRYKSDPEKRALANQRSALSRKKRLSKVSAVEKYIKDNNIILIIVDQ